MGKSVAVWKRILAYIIDSIVISFIIDGPMTVSIENKFEELSYTEIFNQFSSLFDTNFWLVMFFSLLFVLIYWTFLEWKFNQSVGKVIMNLSVENVDKKPLIFSQALIRNISKLSTLVLLIDFLYMLFNKGDQRYFEKLSNTHVIEVKK